MTTWLSRVTSSKPLIVAVVRPVSQSSANRSDISVVLALADAALRMAIVPPWLGLLDCPLHMATAAVGVGGCGGGVEGDGTVCSKARARDAL